MSSSFRWYISLAGTTSSFWLAPWTYMGTVQSEMPINSIFLWYRDYLYLISIFMIVTKYRNFSNNWSQYLILKCYLHSVSSIEILVRPSFNWLLHFFSMATSMRNNTNLGFKTSFYIPNMEGFDQRWDFSRVAYSILHLKVV